MAKQMISTVSYTNIKPVTTIGGSLQPIIKTLTGIDIYLINKARFSFIIIKNRLDKYIKKKEYLYSLKYLPCQLSRLASS